MLSFFCYQARPFCLFENICWENHWLIKLNPNAQDKLTHLWPMLLFYTPWKHYFLMLLSAFKVTFRITALFFLLWSSSFLSFWENEKGNSLKNWPELKSIGQTYRFLTNVPILYPLKTKKRICFPGIFRVYKMGPMARNWLPYLKFSSFTSADLHCRKK